MLPVDLEHLSASPGGDGAHEPDLMKVLKKLGSRIVDSGITRRR
jgi:hypothetical protein